MTKEIIYTNELKSAKTLKLIQKTKSFHKSGMNGLSRGSTPSPINSTSNTSETVLMAIEHTTTQSSPASPDAISLLVASFEALSANEHRFIP